MHFFGCSHTVVLPRTVTNHQIYWVLLTFCSYYTKTHVLRWPSSCLRRPHLLPSKTRFDNKQNIMPSVYRSSVIRKASSRIFSPVHVVISAMHLLCLPIDLFYWYIILVQCRSPENLRLFMICNTFVCSHLDLRTGKLLEIGSALTNFKYDSRLLRVSHATRVQR